MIPSHACTLTCRAAQLYADTLVHFMERAYVKGCEVALSSDSTKGYDTGVPIPSRSHTLMLEHLTCHGSRPLSRFDTESSEMLVNTHTSSAGWRLHEDRPGKPGYITVASNVQNAVLTFNMQCSVKETPEKHLMFPVVVMTYLKSFEGVGVVQMYGRELQHPEDVTEGVLIDALDTSQPISPYTTTYMQLDDTYNSYNSSTAMRGEGSSILNITVNFRALGLDNADQISARLSKESTSTWSAEDDLRQDWKFKIVTLSCC
jgi:hypothetical protein